MSDPWSLPVTYENLNLILSDHRAHCPDTLLCPPPGNPWEPTFNTAGCWAQNYGTPAALTATAQPPMPTATLSPYPYP